MCFHPNKPRHNRGVASKHIWVLLNEGGNKPGYEKETDGETTEDLSPRTTMGPGQVSSHAHGHLFDIPEVTLVDRKSEISLLCPGALSAAWLP